MRKSWLCGIKGCEDRSQDSDLATALIDLLSNCDRGLGRVHGFANVSRGIVQIVPAAASGALPNNQTSGR